MPALFGQVCPPCPDARRRRRPTRTSGGARADLARPGEQGAGDHRDGLTRSSIRSTGRAWARSSSRPPGRRPGSRAQRYGSAYSSCRSCGRGGQRAYNRPLRVSDFARAVPTISSQTMVTRERAWSAGSGSPARCPRSRRSTGTLQMQKRRSASTFADGASRTSLRAGARRSRCRRPRLPGTRPPDAG
jgi:hypothetical protein